MTPYELIELAQRYDKALADRGIALRRDLRSLLEMGDSPGQEHLEHVRWMLGEIVAMAQRTITVLNEMAGHAQLGVTVKEELLEVRLLEGKSHRWLGFAQGILWMDGIFTIDDLQAHVRLDEEALRMVSGLGGDDLEFSRRLRELFAKATERDPDASS